MASEKTLNAKNLCALGAERLAELCLELAAGDAAAKRRLRLELASRTGSGDVAAEIRKRLTSIAKSRSYVDWRKIKPLAVDIDLQRGAIMSHLASESPSEAFDLLWRLLGIAPSIYERCDDSNGTVSSVFSKALNDLAEVAGRANLPTPELADRVFEAVCVNEYAQFDGLIALMAEALGKAGLGILVARFEDLETKLPAKTAKGHNRMIGMGPAGPIFEDDYKRTRQVRQLRTALTQIADALGDVDGYAARFSAEERANPAIAANIAKRMLAADRAEEALTALTLAEAAFQKGGHWLDWQEVRINALDAVGRSEEAQAERWAIFESDLNPEYLRAFMKRLPDFEDEEAEQRALAQVAQNPKFNQALAFLIDWPAHGLAAELIVARNGELDGDQYGLLTPAADALDQRYPLAATLALRAMIDFSLNRARHSRYGHAARHLQTCEYISKRIEDFGTHRDHDAYVANLKRLHGRKSGFWNV